MPYEHLTGTINAIAVHSYTNGAWPEQAVPAEMSSVHAALPRAYASSERDLKAICLILVQLRQFVSQLDGMALLLAQGACATSNLQLRGVLEIAHTLEWTLQSDTLSKIHHLYVANLRSGPLPKIIGAQAAGCSPVATAFAHGTREITPVKARSPVKSAR